MTENKTEQDVLKSRVLHHLEGIDLDLIGELREQGILDAAISSIAHLIQDTMIELLDTGQIRKNTAFNAALAIWTEME